MDQRLTHDQADNDESTTTQKPLHFTVALPVISTSSHSHRRTNIDAAYQHYIHIVTTVPNHCYPTPAPHPAPLQFVKEPAESSPDPSINPIAPSPSSSNDNTGANDEYVASGYERAMVGDWRVTVKAVVCSSSASSAAQGLKSMRRLSTATLVYGPYLQSVGPTSALVVWRQDVSAIGVVHVGLAFGTYTMQFSSSKASTDVVVQLTGLKSMTTYYYTISTPDGLILKESKLNFMTLVSIGNSKPLRMLFLGDPGTGDYHQLNVRDAMRKYGKTIKARTMMFALGDNAYDFGTDYEYQEKFFKVYQEDMKNVPMYAVIGNHDSSSTLSASGKESGPYFDRFITPKAGESGGIPSGSGLYYSIDYGTVHIVCLDSYLSSVSATGAMIQWLKKDLAALKPSSTKWLIAIWHHSPYSAGGLDSDYDACMRDMREKVLPILEAAGVDMVIGGHSHDYQRSNLVNNYYGKTLDWSVKNHQVTIRGSGTETSPYLKPTGVVPFNGIVTVLTGSAGQVDDKNVGLMHPANIKFNGSNLHGLSEFGVFYLDIDSTDLTGTFVTVDGSVKDQFFITKDKYTSPLPLPTPSKTSSTTPTATPSPQLNLITASSSISPTPTSSMSLGASESSSPSESASESITPSPSPSPTIASGGGSTDTSAKTQSTSSTMSTVSFGGIVAGVVAGTSGIALIVLTFIFVSARRKHRHSITKRSTSRSKSPKRQSSLSRGRNRRQSDRVRSVKSHASPVAGDRTPRRSQSASRFSRANGAIDASRAPPVLSLGPGQGGQVDDGDGGSGTMDRTRSKRSRGRSLDRRRELPLPPSFDRGDNDTAFGSQQSSVVSAPVQYHPPRSPPKASAKPRQSILRESRLGGRSASVPPQAMH